MAVLSLRRLQATHLGGFYNDPYTTNAAALTNGVVMKNTSTVNVSEFEAQAQKMVAQAIEICQGRIEANNCNVTPELRVLSNYVVLLDHAVKAFLAAEQLSK